MKISKLSLHKSIPGRRAPRAAILLLALAALACSLFSGPLTPTPTLDFGPTHGPLAIAPDKLPAAQKGVAYDVTIQISQNDTPVGSMEIKDGELPAGLQFEFLDGKDAARISGTPTESGTFTFTLSAWCYGTMISGQTIEKEYQFMVGE